MSLASLLNKTVTITRRNWSNVRGQRTATTRPETVTASGRASPMKSNRVTQHGLQAGETGWTVYFAADPLVKVDDSLSWSDGVGTVTASVLAHARDMGGAGRGWAVDAKEIR
jgi:type II secretory pathway component PulJ